MKSLKQIECIRFRPLDGFCERNGATVRLTKIEGKILDFARTHSGEPLSAERIFNSVWDEPGNEGWRQRVDTHLAGLRAKLSHLGEDLLINQRGLGYSLACPVELIDDRPDASLAQVHPEAISFDKLLERMKPQNHGGHLVCPAEVIVQSPEPLEFVFDREDELIESIRSDEISYLYFVPADSLGSVVKIIEAFVSAVHQGPSEDHDTVNVLLLDRLLRRASQLKINVTQPPMLDTVYILNSKSNNLAAAYYCSTQFRSATCLKKRNEARDMADQLRDSIPDRQGGILGFAEGVDRSAVCTKLETLMLNKHVNVERELLHALVPEVFQRGLSLGLHPAA